MKVRLTAYSMPFLLLLATSCEEVTLPEADTGLQVDPVKRAAKAPPVMGGTNSKVWSDASEPPHPPARLFGAPMVLPNTST